ncbi:hypothetical protein B0A55_03217 [Friedmanniomyces simplex]|uniref:Uncharacterized protein n=1 Tax=Friedmanniomyces simplex TaxID=329884 RepID=A0A4U0XR12_9PEZI|nr:hypothetical protein B0A55_03217 [Friedmanniomyces simplex]
MLDYLRQVFHVLVAESRHQEDGQIAELRVELKQQVAQVQNQYQQVQTRLESHAVTTQHDDPEHAADPVAGILLADYGEYEDEKPDVPSLVDA